MRARFDLMKMQQRKDEPVDVWYQRVQAQLTPCNYSANMEAIQLRDNFVLKLANQEMVGKINSKAKKQGDAYTAEKALEKACEIQQYKATNIFLQNAVKCEPIESQVLAMRSQRTEMATIKSNKWRNNRRQLPPKSKQSNNKQEWKCKRCGGQHQKPCECPAMNKNCHKCGKNGHFARACLAKNSKHRVQSIQADQEMERYETLKYEDSPATRYQASQIKVCAKVNQVKEPHEPPVDKKIVMVTIPYTRNHSNEFKDCIRMRVDTCADINIMPLSVYQTIFNDPKKEKLMPTSIQVTHIQRQHTRPSRKMYTVSTAPQDT